MRINIFSIAFIVFLSFLFSCQQKVDYKSVSVDEFDALIADRNVQCVDVRTSVEYSEAHIPGSLNLNVLDKNFVSIADSSLLKDKPVALYCRSGKRSKKAAAILSGQGYTVYNLAKGFQSWVKAGKKTEK